MTTKISKKQLKKEIEFCKACEYKYLVIYSYSKEISGVYHVRNDEHLSEVLLRFANSDSIMSYKIIVVSRYEF